MSLAGDDKEEMRNHPSFNFNNNSDNNISTPREQKPGPPIFDPNPVGSSKHKPTNSRVSYRECLKNHAATMGGTVTDGCGEFMPSGEDGTLEALKCAACNCHRNFHRRETAHHHHLPPPSPSVVHPMKIAFCGGGGGGSVGTESSSEEFNFGSYHSNMVAPPPPPHLSAKKRVRTKFTAEQKERMMACAEKLGWRIPREGDSEMQRFCGEVGVKRQVFKVWMHNNKSGSGTTGTGSAKKNPDQEFN